MSSQAEELLNDILEDDAELGDAYLGTMILGEDPYEDLYPHIVIGADRFIKVPQGLKRIAVEHDHAVETVTFDCPRYWDGRDLSTMKIYINYIRGDKQPGSFPVDNGVTIDENDSNIIHFDWTITRELTEFKGNIVFLVCAKKVDAEGYEEQHWNSELNKDMYVSEGLEAEETIAQQYPDLITYLLSRMDVVENKTTLESMLNYLDLYFTTDASINEVLQNYVSEYLSSSDEVTKKIADTVNAYIQEHLSTTDKTLTVEGGMADAAATGYEIRNIVDIKQGSVLNGSAVGPMKVRKILGKSEQDGTSGKQLLDLTGAVGGTNSGIAVTVNDDGSYSFVGTAESKDINVFLLGSYSNKNALFTLPAGDYYCSGVVLFTYDGTNRATYLDTFTLTKDTPITAVRVKRSTSGVTYNERVYPMLNAGSTALPWEPYTGGQPSPNPEYPQEIRSVVVNEVKAHGKNLLKNTATSNTVNGVTFTVNDDGSVTANGRATADAIIYIDKATLSAGSYICSGCPSGGNAGEGYSMYFGTENAFDTGSGYSLVLSEEKSLDRIRVIVRNGVKTSNLVFKPMIRLASITDGTYEPYTESTMTLSKPVTLNGIGDVMDELTPDGVVRKFAKVVFDGSEDGWQYNDTVSRIVKALPDAKVSSDNSATPNIVSSAFVSASVNAHANVDGNITITTSGNLCMRWTAFKSLSDWTAYMSENPITVVYELATPVIEPIPDVDAKALKTAIRAYDTVTYVTTDSPVEPGFELEYPRSLAASYILENQKDIAELTKEVRTNFAEIAGEDLIKIQDSKAGGIRIVDILGRSEQESLSGKNLLKNTATSQTVNGVTFTFNEDGTVTVNGTATKETDLACSADTLPAGTYIFSGCPSGGNLTDTFDMFLANTATSGTIARDYDGSKTQTFTLTETTTVRARLRVRNGYTASNLTFYPMIREASITDGTYEPYTGGQPSPNPEYPQEIKSVVVNEVKAHGKNLLDLSSIASSTGNGVTFTVNTTDGYVMADGTASDYAIKLVTLDLKPGRYSLNGRNTDVSPLTYCVMINKADGESVRYYDHFTIDGTEQRVRVRFQVNKDNTATNEIVYPMLNEGDTALPWQPYTENSITLSKPVTLNGIGDVMDELTPDGVIRRIGKAVFDGSADEDWGVYSDPVGVRYFTRRNGVNLDNLKIIKSIGSHHIMCQKSNIGNFSDEQYVRTDGVNVTFDFNFKVGYITDDSTDNLRTWLAKNPITVLYELATPTFEPLPTADQIALRSLLSYDGVTYIELDADLPPTEMRVRYGASEIGGLILKNENLGEVNELLISENKTLLETKATTGDANARFAGILVGDTPNTDAYIYSDGNGKMLLKSKDNAGNAQYINVGEVLMKDAFTVSGDTLIINFL